MSFTLLPKPRSVEWGEDRVAVGPNSPIRITGGEVAEDDIRFLARRGTGSTPIVVCRDKSLPGEGYRIEVSREAVALAAADARGERYGVGCLRQLLADGLRDDGVVRVGRIEDAPALPLRGYQIRFSIPSIGFEEGMQLLDAMARWRLNTVLLEYNGQYPYAGRRRDIRAPDALTRGQVRKLVGRARALGIEAIPLHQCLGHVEFILKRPACAHLSEEAEHRDQFCPLKPESLALFKECVDDFLDLHPGLRYFHMGGDETRRLGACPACAAAAAKHGKGRLYVDYVTRAAEYVLSRGLTPIVWDDMLCAHSEVIEQMPREAVIMYWDYWTVSDPCPIVVARPENGTGIVVDRRWLGEWDPELNEVERRMIRHFARAMDFESDLSQAYRGKFKTYLGAQFPKRIRAFPYLEYYQDLGFKVMGAPTGAGNTSTWRGLPDFPRYADNIGAFCRRLRDAGSLGVVTTNWYHFPPESFYPGLMATGQFAWTGGAEVATGQHG